MDEFNDSKDLKSLNIYLYNTIKSDERGGGKLKS